MRPFNRIDFDGKWIVLTGASSGIGQAIAVALSSCNAKLLLIGRDEDTLTHTADKLSGSDARLKVMDLAEVDSISSELKKELSEVGRVYGLCHCAGVVETQALTSSKPGVFLRQLTVNLIAGMEVARTVVRRDRMEKEGGSLLFMASLYARVGAPGQTAYCASKGAVAAAVRAMAVELAPRNIRVNSLSPGFIKTTMTEYHARLSQSQLDAIIAKHPLGAGTPDDIARAAVFLLDPANCWTTGTDLVVDGGYTAT